MLSPLLLLLLCVSTVVRMENLPPLPPSDDGADADDEPLDLEDLMESLPPVPGEDAQSDDDNNLEEGIERIAQKLTPADGDEDDADGVDDFLKVFVSYKFSGIVVTGTSSVSTNRESANKHWLVYDELGNQPDTRFLKRSPLESVRQVRVGMFLKLQTRAR